MFLIPQVEHKKKKKERDSYAEATKRSRENIYLI